MMDTASTMGRASRWIGGGPAVIVKNTFLDGFEVPGPPELPELVRSRTSPGAVGGLSVQDVVDDGGHHEGVHDNASGHADFRDTDSARGFATAVVVDEAPQELEHKERLERARAEDAYFDHMWMMPMNLAVVGVIMVNVLKRNAKTGKALLTNVALQPWWSGLQVKQAVNALMPCACRVGTLYLYNGQDVFEDNQIVARVGQLQELRVGFDKSAATFPCEDLEKHQNHTQGIKCGTRFCHHPIHAGASGNPGKKKRPSKAPMLGEPRENRSSPSLTT